MVTQEHTEIEYPYEEIAIGERNDTLIRQG